MFFAPRYANSFFLGLVAFAAHGCAESARPVGQDAGPIDAALDDASDVRDISSSSDSIATDAPSFDGSDGACTTEPIAVPRGAKVRLFIAGDEEPFPLPQWPCQAGTTFDFSPEARTIQAAGCLDRQPVFRTALLSEAKAADMLARLQAMRTTCERTCFADTYRRTLTINVDGCIRASYQSNDTSDCSRIELLPYVDHRELMHLDETFRALMNGACDDGGGPEDGCFMVDGGSAQVCRAVRATKDASTDVANDTSADGDAGACAALPIWSETSTSFALRIFGGADTGFDGGCSPSYTFFRFSTQTGTLARQGCHDDRYDHYEVTLVREQIDSTVAMLRAITTTCDTGCTPGIPETSLVVRDCIAQVEGTYVDNSAAACPGTARTPPFISLADALSLTQRLNDVIAQSCDPVDAATPGICRPHCRGGSASR